MVDYKHNEIFLGKLKKPDTQMNVMTMEMLDELIGEENLMAQDGDQKYYVLSDSKDLGKIMDKLPSALNADFIQNNWWHRTHIEQGEEEQSILIEILEQLHQIDERLENMEHLLISNNTKK